MGLNLNYKFVLLLSSLAAIASVLLNSVAASVLWYGYKLVPVWGPGSMANYLFIFSILIAFMMAWLVTKATRYAIRLHKVLPLHWHLKSKTLIDNLPTKTMHRSVVLAVASGLMTSFALYLLQITGLHTFYVTELYYFSNVYVMLQAVAITVMAIYRAMGDNVMWHTKIA